MYFYYYLYLRYTTKLTELRWEAFPTNDFFAGLTRIKDNNLDSNQSETMILLQQTTQLQHALLNKAPLHFTEILYLYNSSALQYSATLMRH